jgi:hypothetical protein
MEFLKDFWRSISTHTCAPGPFSEFEDLTAEQLDAHLRVDRYGDFLLAEAIRPSFDVAIVPQVGYRHDTYRDGASVKDVPVIAAAVSREYVLDLFMDLLEPMGDQVDVVLESSHDPEVDGHVDLYRDGMDLVVLKSLLYDFEELLLKDGYTGIAVLRPDIPIEVQFDEHKLIFVYADNIQAFENVIHSYGLKRRDDLQLISEGEHLHLTEERFSDRFAELKLRLGVEE